MTFEERMAELGVDLSDLNVDVDRGNALYEKYFESAKQIAEEKGLWFNALLLATLVIHDICERDDIIDRMETRLVNVTGERDWLQTKCCAHCAWTEDGPGACDNCDMGDSVPEDWRADDGPQI